MEISTENLKKILYELIEERKDIFLTEREFQIELRDKLQEKFVHAGIFMECMYPLDKEVNKNHEKIRNHIDIIIYNYQKTYPIELKYNAWDNGKCIAGTSDCNINRCNFWEDIILTEKTLEQYNWEYGYCIFLTNNEYLYKDKNETKITKELKLFDGRKIEPEIKYERDGINKNLRKKYVFQNSYTLNWDKINKATFNGFQLLVVKVENKSAKYI